MLVLIFFIEGYFKYAQITGRSQTVFSSYSALPVGATLEPQYQK